MKNLALITGGTSGIGKAIAENLATTHDLALCHGGNVTRAERAAAEIAEKSPETRIRIYSGALNGDADTLDLHRKVVRDFDRPVGTLIHSLGGISDVLVASSLGDENRKLVEQHLLVGMAISRLCVPPMLQVKHGRIVFVTSISARYCLRGQSAYAAAKAGLESYARTLALEIAHRGVTVNCVAPGLIRTPLTETIVRRLENAPEPAKAIREKIPAGFIGEPADVAALVEFLCSDRARFITGAVIPVDGGRSIGDPGS